MPAPVNGDDFLELVRKSGVVDDKRLETYTEKLRAAGPIPTSPTQLAGQMVHDGIITQFQAQQFLLGKWRRFTLGKYKVLERIGQGGMGTVFLCEHKVMRRRAAVKVLPTAKAEDPASLKRFYRESQAVAALDHPNIVRAYDIDHEDNLHYLVMEYVDGASLQEIVKKCGPMDVMRACHYMRQAAIGLQHAHDVAGLVHRDIKPSNLLVDRTGTLKILDMGLARFFHDEDDLTRQFDEAVLGTADYLAPEQALDSHAVDIRADIYGLGATFYYVLAGAAPFKDGSVTQKLIWHQTRSPRPIREIRPEVPEGVAAVIDRMMAKDPGGRYQRPIEVAEALAPWTQQPIGPPPAEEMPQLCLAAQAVSMGGPDSATTPPPSSSASARSVAMPVNGTPTGPTPAPQLAVPVAEPVQAPSTLVASDATQPTAEPALTEPFAALDTSDDSSLPWQRLPIAGPTATRRSAVKRREKRIAIDRRKVWLAAGGGGAALVIVLLCIVAFWPRRGASPETPAVVGRTLIVQQDGAEGTFRTVQEAVNRARRGDRVVVRDERIEGCLQLKGETGEGITIEGGVPGKGVLWTCPINPPDGLFLSLDRVQNLHLKGFTIDGLKHAVELITITGRCPGLTFEDVQLRGFNGSALSLVGASGKPGDGAIQLKQVHITGSVPQADGVVLGGAYCAHVDIEDSLFEGPLASAVHVACSVAHIEMHKNRLHGLKAGLYYEYSSPRYALDIDLLGNTLSDIDVALNFEGFPMPGTSTVHARRNLFVRTHQLVQVKKEQPTPQAMKQLFDQSADNVRDAHTPIYAALPTEAAQAPIVLGSDAHNDATYLRYPRSSALIHQATNNEPVGVPQAEAN